MRIGLQPERAAVTNAASLDARADELVVRQKALTAGLATMSSLSGVVSIAGFATATAVGPVAAVAGGLLAAGWAVSRRSLRHLELFRVAVDRATQNSHLDGLTRLNNRCSFMQALDDALMGGAVSGEVSVAFVDFDGFKAINDGLGHDAGDSLLAAFAYRLRSLCGEGAMAARLGGDEFAVLVRGEEAGAAMLHLVRSLEKALEQPFALDGSMVPIGVSIGVAVNARDATSRGEILRRADVAMYRAKSQGRGRHCIYSPDMDDEASRRRRIQGRLEQAISDGSLRLAYQPIFNARSGELCGAEALVRWPRADGQSVSPGEFIPIAEDSGLILELGQWALETALRQVKAWGHVPVSVNVSPLQIRNHAFVRMVENAIRSSGVAPGLLRIEITESVLNSHADVAEQSLVQLRNLGVGLVLDDFGSGLSSFGHLRRFRFDTVKIDRALAWEATDGAQLARMLKPIIELSHGLGMQVVAEGIENEQQAAMLRLLGCDQMQGFLLGEPADEDQFAARYLGRRASALTEAPPVTAHLSALA